MHVQLYRVFVVRFTLLPAVSSPAVAILSFQADLKSPRSYMPVAVFTLSDIQLCDRRR